MSNTTKNLQLNTHIYFNGKINQSQTLPFATKNIFEAKSSVLHHIKFYLPY